MDTTPFDQEGFADFIKAAFTGPNAFVFVALNIIALTGYRRGHAWAFWIAAAMAAMIGGLSTLIEMQAKGGAFAEPIRLMHAMLTGMITGGASSLVVAYTLILMISRLASQKIERMLPPGNGDQAANGKAPEAGKGTTPPEPPPAA